MGFVDLSHPLADGGGRASASPPRIGSLVDHFLSGGPARAAEGHSLDGTTTCLHAPTERGTGVADLASLLLEEVAGVPGVVVTVDPAVRAIPSRALGTPQALHGRAVLLRTGWDDRWATASYREPGPYLAAETAEVLVRAGARVIGVDFANVDDTVGDARPVHAKLLGHGVPVVEHLTNLAALPPTGFRFYAVPLAIVRGASVPIRAFAEVEGPLRA